MPLIEINWFQHLNHDKLRAQIFFLEGVWSWDEYLQPVSILPGELEGGILHHWGNFIFGKA